MFGTARRGVATCRHHRARDLPILAVDPPLLVQGERVPTLPQRLLGPEHKSAGARAHGLCADATHNGCYRPRRGLTAQGAGPAPPALRGPRHASPGQRRVFGQDHPQDHLRGSCGAHGTASHPTPPVPLPCSVLPAVQGVGMQSHALPDAAAHTLMRP